MEASPGSPFKRNFILQQGLDEPPSASCPLQYSALHFQPRLVGIVVLAGILLQEPAIFLALSAVLLWSALLPRWNPFDALYNRTFAGQPGRFLLPPAPAPRRFAQGMAGTFALAIGIALLQGWKTTAIVLEVLLVVAVAALVFGGFCLGSFVFHLIRGRLAFARRTLPWARDTEVPGAPVAR
jgi:uncharacterized protein DUF4395